MRKASDGERKALAQVRKAVVFCPKALAIYGQVMFAG
jgi:hypothetical protein